MKFSVAGEKGGAKKWGRPLLFLTNFWSAAGEERERLVSRSRRAVDEKRGGGERRDAGLTVGGDVDVGGRKKKWGGGVRIDSDRICRRVGGRWS